MGISKTPIFMTNYSNEKDQVQGSQARGSKLF